jgi:hypothetical protein
MAQWEQIPGWASRPDEFIRAALLLSVLAHLAAMAFWKLPFPPMALEGRKALTVILLPRQGASAPKPEVPSLPEPAVKEAPAEATIKPEPPKAELLKPPPPPAISSPQQRQPSDDAPAPENQPVKEDIQALPADPVVENYLVQSAGKAQALLLVDESGTVRQIIWKQLPAVSEAELKEMERRLRQRGYLARGKLYTVPESIEIPREH